jgi:hypothetical protein
MSSIDVPLERGRFGQTSRRDFWWVQPLLTFLGLGTFIVYSTWAAFQGDHFRFGPYLSPFYSPEIFSLTGEDSWFGQFPSRMPYFVTGAMLILWAPGGFRFTCYYYRGAYYKAFWLDPPSCTVGEPRKSYWGERSLPLVIQNIHRYFLIFALILIVLLAHDAWDAMWFTDGFHINVGTLVLTLNAILLGCYTLGCHSLRHLIGGISDVISRSPIRKTAYDCVSCLNARHMRFAWFSLVWVGFTDVYVRMCSMGVWTDWRLF